MPHHLEFLLHPVTLEKFLNGYYQAQALYIPGNKEKFENLFGWGSLNKILNASRQPHPTVKMSREGKQFTPKDATNLIRASQNGATFILEHADRYDLNLGDFLNNLTEEVCEEARLNVYLSHPNQQGYRIHYDTQDFFILQIAGYKEWWVYPETIPSVSFHQKVHGNVPPSEDSLYLNCILSPGDVLYVPRGHWHHALCREESSLHLTLSVFTKTGVEFVKWLADELTEHESFRRSLPLAPGTGTGEQKRGIRRLQSDLIDLLKKEGEDLCERFLQYRTAVSRNRQPFNFPFHLASSPQECRKFTVFQRRIQHAKVLSCENEREVYVICGGRVVAFEIAAEPLLQFVFSATAEFSKEELIATSGGLEWNAICTVLSPLIQEGFVTPTR